MAEENGDSYLQDREKTEKMKMEKKKNELHAEKKRRKERQKELKRILATERVVERICKKKKKCSTCPLRDPVEPEAMPCVKEVVDYELSEWIKKWKEDREKNQ